MNAYIKKTSLYRYCTTLIKKLVIFIDPKIEIKRCYQRVFHTKIDLKNPKNLIEKIFWMELNTDTSMWSKCADKYLMREYVDSCGLGEYLPLNLGKWDDAKDINFAELPNEFILKTNNGCGENIIVKNKSEINEQKIKKILHRYLSNSSLGYNNAQLHYLKIKPCIIAEELLKNDPEANLISPASLIDYKVWCFNGYVESIWVAYNRTDENVKMALFDTLWNPMPQYLQDTSHFKYNPEDKISKPECLDDILKMASILSKPFPEVRVDFYIINNRPIVGELTFSTGYGYFTKDYYTHLGRLCSIN